MKFSFTLAGFHELLAAFQQQTGGNYQLYGCETQLALPEPFGQGSLRIVSLRDGLTLFISEYFLEEHLILNCVNTTLERSQIILKFFLSGRVSGSVEGFKDELLALPGSCSLIRWPEGAAGTVEFARKSQICTIELGIAPALFRTMVDEPDTPHPVELQRLLDTAQTPDWQWGQSNPLMAIALQQILHCPYQGATRRLYLESKVLELITLHLEQFKANQPPKLQPSQPLKPEDISLIYQARDILLRQMDNPPSLLALARQVGINDHKLKRGFRQVFGTTVFGYLHDCRMERAAQLLQANQTTVTSVAQTVGFAHRGCFAAAFKRKYGMNPSDYLAAYRKQYWDLQPPSSAKEQ
ncbi:MAG: AraC family transcriptional regulator [Cyanobacteria bacterium P01_G01_bin.54]